MYTTLHPAFRVSAVANEGRVAAVVYMWFSVDFLLSPGSFGTSCA